jgi:hypothetical protein
MIIAILPEARSMDLDNILFAAFAGRAAPESYAGEVFDPANEKAWIKDYVRALDGAAAIRNISVHLMRTPYEPMDDIAADLAANRDKAVSYVVSDSPSGELDANIVKINTAALLRAASTGKSSLVAMGNYTYRSFDGIMSVLRDLRILPMIVKVSDAIVEIFAAMKAAAISA